MSNARNTVTVKAWGLGEPVMWSAEIPREMTAEDLGLPPLIVRLRDAAWARLHPAQSDAPYAFWLGAEG